MNFDTWYVIILFLTISFQSDSRATHNESVLFNLYVTKDMVGKIGTT